VDRTPAIAGPIAARSEKHLRRRTAILFLAAASAASAAAASGPGLDAPADGDVFRAGRTLRVAWTDRPAFATEWEAFLSLDGGRTFPIRVTPHLDVSTRSFLWRLPLLSADEARIRLRFGNGSAEVEYDPATRFSIRPSADSRPLTPSVADVGATALPGESESVAWTCAAGDGRNFRTVTPPVSAGLAPSSAWEAESAVHDALRTETAAVPVPGFDSIIRTVRLGARALSTPGGEPVSPLARSSRLNV
jgi:hypothetical protein